MSKSDKVAGRSKKSQKRRKKGSGVLACGLMESREGCVSRSKRTSMSDVAGMSNKMTGKCQVTRRPVVILGTTVSLSDG